MRKTMITMTTVALASSVFAGIAVAGGDGSEKEVSASVDNRQCSPTYAPLISSLTLAHLIGSPEVPTAQGNGSCN